MPARRRWLLQRQVRSAVPEALEKCRLQGALPTAVLRPELLASGAGLRIG